MKYELKFHKLDGTFIVVPVIFIDWGSVKGVSIVLGWLRWAVEVERKPRGLR